MAPGGQTLHTFVMRSNEHKRHMQIKNQRSGESEGTYWIWKIVMDDNDRRAMGGSVADKLCLLYQQRR